QHRAPQQIRIKLAAYAAFSLKAPAGAGRQHHNDRQIFIEHVSPRITINTNRNDLIVMADLKTQARWLLLAANLLLFLCFSPLAAAQSLLGKDIPFRWYED